MSDVRSGSYCEVVSQEVPAHRCLCWEAPRHAGEHRCLCGHVWGPAWAEMSYDEQRAFLGLPTPHRIPMYMDVARAISAATHLFGDMIVVEGRPGEWDFSEMGREAVQGFLKQIESEAS